MVVLLEFETASMKAVEMAEWKVLQLAAWTEGGKVGTMAVLSVDKMVDWMAVLTVGMRVALMGLSKAVDSV